MVQCDTVIVSRSDDDTESQKPAGIVDNNCTVTNVKNLKSDSQNNNCSGADTMKATGIMFSNVKTKSGKIGRFKSQLNGLFSDW